MASGPEMLLKAMGIDPVAIKEMMEKTIGNIQFIADSLKEIRASQERIEARLDVLEAEKKSETVPLKLIGNSQ